MNCPHCMASISYLSPALMGPAKPGGARLCSHCGEHFKIGRKGTRKSILMFVTVFVISLLLLRVPVVGFPLMGLAVALGAFVTLTQLEKF